MPRETFFHLPDEKRRRILNAALAEFSQYRFSDSSINRIVKAAEIPRGSFYQYFADKEDLYLHILHIISQEKIQIIETESLLGASDTPRDFYQLLMDALPQVFDWAEQNQQYYQIGLLMVQDDSDFIRQIIAKMDHSQQFLVDFIKREQRAGRIRPDVNPQIVLRLVISIVTSLLNDYYLAESREEALRSIRQVFQILCYGFVTNLSHVEMEESE